MFSHQVSAALLTALIVTSCAPRASGQAWLPAGGSISPSGKFISVAWQGKSAVRSAVYDADTGRLVKSYNSPISWGIYTDALLYFDKSGARVENLSVKSSNQKVSRPSPRDNFRTYRVFPDATLFGAPDNDGKLKLALCTFTDGVCASSTAFKCTTPSEIRTVPSNAFSEVSIIIRCAENTDNGTSNSGAYIWKLGTSNVSFIPIEENNQSLIISEARGAPELMLPIPGEAAVIAIDIRKPENRREVKFSTVADTSAIAQTQYGPDPLGGSGRSDGRLIGASSGSQLRLTWRKSNLMGGTDNLCYEAERGGRSFFLDCVSAPRPVSLPARSKSGHVVGSVLWPQINGGKGLVAYVHGGPFLSNQFELDALSAAWYFLGYSVLQINYIGDSNKFSIAGMPSDNSDIMEMSREVVNATNSARTNAQYAGKPTIIVGNSFGGLIGLMAANSINPRGTFLVSPACDVASQVANLGDPAWSIRGPYRTLLAAQSSSAKSLECKALMRNAGPTYVMYNSTDPNVGAPGVAALEIAATQSPNVMIRKAATPGHLVTMSEISDSVHEAERYFSGK